MPVIVGDALAAHERGAASATTRAERQALVEKVHNLQ